MVKIGKVSIKGVEKASKSAYLENATKMVNVANVKDIAVPGKIARQKIKVPGGELTQWTEVEHLELEDLKDQGIMAQQRGDQDTVKKVSKSIKGLMDRVRYK